MPQVTDEATLKKFYSDLVEVQGFLTHGHAPLVGAYVFTQACEEAQISGIQDIPEDATIENGINIRRLFLDVSWIFVQGNAEELSELERSEAVRLEVKEIVRALSDNNESSFK